MLKAVIFDFDGVIANTPMISFNAWKTVFKKHGINFTKKLYFQFQAVKSETKIPIILKKFKKYSPGLAQKILKEREAAKRHFLVEMPDKELKEILILGSIEFIKKLSKTDLKIGLATSSLRKTHAGTAKRIGIFKLFDAFICGDDVKKSKPNPEMYLTTAKKLNVDPKNCIVFEDSVNGIKSAHNAGMKCIAVNSNNIRGQLAKEKPLKIIKDFRNLSVEKLYSHFPSG